MERRKKAARETAGWRERADGERRDRQGKERANQRGKWRAREEEMSGE